MTLHLKGWQAIIAAPFVFLFLIVAVVVSAGLWLVVIAVALVCGAALLMVLLGQMVIDAWKRRRIDHHRRSSQGTGRRD